MVTEDVNGEGSSRHSRSPTAVDYGDYGSPVGNDLTPINNEGPVGERNDRYEHNKDGGEESGWRAHRPRTSGGFLLGSVTPHQASKRHTIHEGRSEKGKGRLDGTNTLDRERGQRSLRHRPKPSIGSSPLATKVTNATPSQDTAHYKDYDQDRILSTHSDSGEGVTLSINGDSKSELREPPSQKTAHRDSIIANPADFDADPAQIVRLALKLSESRRRNFSASLLSPIDAPGNRRVISMGQLSAGYATSPLIGNAGGSLKQQLQQQRHISRNISPRSDKFGRAKAVSPVTRPLQDNHENFQPPFAPTLDLGWVDDFNFNPSDATLARAEKARLSIELFYEYRRLLQYLPKLPIPSKRRPSTEKGAAGKTLEAPLNFGRSYNPLQYVRNRKVRARERKAFHSEADGWKNLDRVRDWVTSVESEHQDNGYNVDESISLPTFHSPKEEDIVDGTSPGSTVRHNNGPLVTQPRRPRMDWSTTPWDLLADAYWLDQVDNKFLVEDRDGNRLFAATNSQVEQPPRISRDVVRVPGRRSDSITRSYRSPERTDEVVMEAQDGSIKDRGRRRHQFRDSISSLNDLGGSQDRKTRWRKIIRSRSSSSSEGSRRDSLSSLRRFPMAHENRERQDSAVLEKQIIDMLEKESETTWSSPLGAGGQAVDKDEGKDTDGAQDYRRNSTAKEFENFSMKQAQRRRMGDRKQANGRTSGKVSLEELRGRKPRTSYDELDITAPNSPTALGFVPNISINLSPPGSRSVSPKKPLPFPFRGKSGHSKERQFINEADSAIDVDLSKSDSRQGINKIDSISTPIGSATAASDSLLSPKITEGVGRNVRHPRPDSNPVKGVKGQKEEPRIRGRFRGGRIAEIVGNEVSKVGGFLLRRDNSTHTPDVSSPAWSFASDMSDSEEDISFTNPTSATSNRLSRAAIDSDEEGKLSRKSTNPDQPKYYMNNLPSFKSPTRKDDQLLHVPSVLLGNDHITRQQMALRERGRSSRFERLAPPKMDLTGVSASPSPPLTRVQTKDTDATYDESRRNSTNPSEQSWRRADHQFSGVSGDPQNIKGFPITGLAHLDIRRHDSKERPIMAGKRQWSITDRGVSAVRGAVTEGDVTRVRALLLSSGVKASKVVRRAAEISDPPPPILQNLERTTKAPLPRVPRYQEHVLAAHLLLDNIDETYSELKEAAHQFSHTTVNGLHDQIKSIDDQITNQLTPFVRASADDADALNLELTTSRRLAVKRLNDGVDSMIRRRRRRLRWVRRGGYLLLEWALLSLMWWVWLIVVIIRLVRGAIMGVFNSIKWLFWL